MKSSVKGKQGFASMDPARQKALAKLGGKAAHEKGTGHVWDSASATEAGRKGGLTRAARRREREGQS